MESKAHLWKVTKYASDYLDGVRGAIPMAAEQLEIMLRLLRRARPQLQSCLDIGCGNGVLGKAVMETFAGARCVFMDFSELMLSKAQASFGGDNRGASFVLADYGHKEWLDAIAPHAPFDAIVSGFSIHHQTDERKRELYGEIYELLTPGGVFLNLEHVASPSDWVESANSELFIDSLYQYHAERGEGKTREQVAEEFYFAPVTEANILAPVETQCRWLLDIGFQHVDCYFKVFELALFGGIKPER
jgi:tRNA (cmo5U34)-methyltransferase